MARPSDRCSRIFTSAFVSFFIMPAVVVTALAVMAPDRIGYDNGGLVLLLSVVGGALFGALIGSIEYPVMTDRGDGLTWVEDLWDRDLDT